MKKIGILGVDSTHFDLFGNYFSQQTPQLEVSSVWGENLTQAKEKSARITPEAVVYSTAEQAIENSDFVLVLNRFPELHPVLASKVLRAGKRVYIDKPIAYSTANFTPELLDPKFREQWISFSVCRLYDEIQTARLSTPSFIQLTGPLECLDLGDDPRFRDISFYGIHSLEMALEVAGTIQFEEKSIYQTKDGLCLCMVNGSKRVEIFFNRVLTGEDYRLTYKNNQQISDHPIHSTLKIYERAGKKIESFFLGNSTDPFLRDSAEFAVRLIDDLRKWSNHHGRN